jgi:hypothetical protein
LPHRNKGLAPCRCSWNCCAAKLQHRPNDAPQHWPGLRAYQEAPRPAPREPMPAIANAGRAVLRDYGGEGLPVVFVPSLINPPLVLDLAEENSLLLARAAGRAPAARRLGHADAR